MSGNGVVLYKNYCWLYFKTMEDGNMSNVAVYDYSTNWAHWACVREGTSLSVYRNATLMQSDTNTVRALTRSVSAYVGTTHDASSDYDLDGTVDQVLVYDRALSTSEINSVYLFTEYAIPSLGVFGPATFDANVVCTTNSTVVFSNGVSYVKPLGDLEMGDYDQE